MLPKKAAIQLPIAAFALLTAAVAPSRVVVAHVDDNSRVARRSCSRVIVTARATG